ncbi:YadA-like family protein [Paludibacterium yongneupense]|uniref:YadA-like family protein n=1 Tax=Paludibacterium yongneupense TaxID=400061 RepID=UPI00041A07D4|nr:YadA C-terminal domain-containing protein [Paludibacterium yongneupense]
MPFIIDKTLWLLFTPMSSNAPSQLMPPPQAEVVSNADKRHSGQMNSKSPAPLAARQDPREGAVPLRTETASYIYQRSYWPIRKPPDNGENTRPQRPVQDGQKYRVPLPDPPAVAIDMRNVQSGLEYRIAAGERRLEQRIDSLEKRTREGVALGAALAGLRPNPRGTDSHHLAMGVGSYAGSQALALGYFMQLGQRAMLNASMATTGPSRPLAGSVGATLSW